MLGRIHNNKAGKGSPYYVTFKGIFKRFKTLDIAERWLTGVRFQHDHGTFDPRDWQRGEPLGFTTLSEKWLDYRKGRVRCFRNLRNHICKAQSFFGQRNIRSIQYSDLEDLYQAFQGQNISSKTQKNVFVSLHAFWVWVNKREGIPVPEFPVIKVSLGWRNTIDKSTQLAILDEVKKISWDLNPRIWIGIKWLSTYYEIRPIELIHVKEKDINHETGTMAVWYSKVDIPKIIYLLDVDILQSRSLGPAFPELYFFRHIKGNGKAMPGQRFGPNYLWKWWKKACNNLKINGVDLYGGTRHSTVRDLAQRFTPEQIKHGGWQTNKAFERYLGPVQLEQKRAIYRHAQGDKQVINFSGHFKNRNPL